MFTIRKKGKISERDKELTTILEEKKLPIVTLDEKWYGLFPEHMKTSSIKKSEKILMDLVKKQGEDNNKLKELKKNKNLLMKDIVENMEVSGKADDKGKSKKVDDSQKKINDINEEIDKIEEELVDIIPQEIEKANLSLAIESMNNCYERMKDNNKVIEETTEWIQNIRNELKERILLKQDCEIKNSEIYTYMHDILGPDLLDIFDIGEPKILAKIDGGKK